MEFNAGTDEDKRLQVPNGSVDHGSLACCEGAREAMPCASLHLHPHQETQRRTADLDLIVLSPHAKAST